MAISCKFAPFFAHIFATIFLLVLGDYKHILWAFLYYFYTYFLWKTRKKRNTCVKKRYFDKPIGNHVVGGKFLPKTTTIYRKIAPTKHEKMHPRLESAFVIFWEFDFVDLHQTLCWNKTQNNRDLPTRLLVVQRAFRR